MKSFSSPRTQTNCLFCYSNPSGELLRDALVERFDYWDLALNRLEARHDMGKMAAGLLIASPTNLGHVEAKDDILDAAIVEAARIGAVAAELLVKHVGQLDNWDGSFGEGINHGAKAGRTVPHFHQHIVPVLGGEVEGGYVKANTSLNSDYQRSLRQ